MNIKDISFALIIPIVLFALFALIAGLILFLLMAYGIPSMTVKADTKSVTAFSGNIADFDLPPGYRTDYTVNVQGYTVAAFRPGDGHSHLYLIQSENIADGQKLETALSGFVPGTGNPQTSMFVMETRPATVRGEDVTLVISEGINGEGMAYRQIITVFGGKGGPAVLIFSEPIDHWDQEKVDTMLASIH